MQTYEQVLEYIFAALPMYQRVGAVAYKADLTNTIALCAAIDNPHQKIKTIHIGGTNGKGSTTHFLAAILTAAGYKVGVYTSPHYIDFRERIKIGKTYISKAFITNFINQNKAVLDEIQPSFFEMTVALAFDYFANQKVDIALIEVGLGGRLDSTNIITPLLSVITNISLDHQQFLGDTLPEIAGEKAGIIKPKIPVVISETQPEVAQVFIEKAKKCDSLIYFADSQLYIENKAIENVGLRADIGDSKTRKIRYPQLKIGAAGDYQWNNVLGVLQAVAVLRQANFEITDAAVYEGLANVRALTGFQGRWQQLDNQPLTIADSGHNEGGLRLTMQQLAALNKQKIHFVLGVVNDKTLDTMLDLLPKTAVYYFAKADIPRGLAADELQQKAAEISLHGEVYTSIQAAYAAARAAAHAERDVVFVGGSCFTVAEVL